MSLVSLEFAFFLPVLFLLHWILPRKAAVQNTVLLLASYLFYVTWNWKLLGVLVVGTLLDYAIGAYLGRRTRGETGRPDRSRRLAFSLSVVYGVGALVYFKYMGFFTRNLNEVLDAVSLGTSLPVLQLALPIGISYYTMTRLGYMIDVYYERIAPCRSLLDFALFTSFFPQLIAGPITRGDDMLPQMQKARRLDPAVLAAGGGIFLLGFFMKSYIANWIGPTFVDPVFAEPQSYATASVWIALWSYSIQVFCDFAGYSFLAIGVGRFFGLELPENFRYPFLSRNMREFWTRWHITLNNWLFDYLYGPMVTGKGWMRGRLDYGFVWVFLLCGLWHGANWTFLLWGLMHGLALVVHHRWDEFYKGLCRQDRKWVALRKGMGYAIFSWFLTQLFFLVSLVPFRAVDLGNAVEFAGRLFVPAGGDSLNLVSINLLVCLGFLVVYHALEIQPGNGLRSAFLGLPAPVRGVAYGLVIVFLFVFVPIGVGAFIYGGF